MTPIDGDPWSLARLLAELHSAAERILPGPRQLRERFVDDDRLRRVEVVLRGEDASGDDRDLQGVEESGRDDFDRDTRSADRPVDPAVPRYS